MLSAATPPVSRKMSLHYGVVPEASQGEMDLGVNSRLILAPLQGARRNCDIYPGVSSPRLLNPRLMSGTPPAFASGLPDR